MIASHCVALVTEFAIDLIAVVIYGRRALQLCATSDREQSQQSSLFDHLVGEAQEIFKLMIHASLWLRMRMRINLPAAKST